MQRSGIDTIKYHTRFILDHICITNQQKTALYSTFLKISNGLYKELVRKTSRPLKIVNEYGQEIPQSQRKSQKNPWHHEEEPHNHHETPVRQTKQSNQLSLPHQDDCKTRMDIK